MACSWAIIAAKTFTKISGFTHVGIKKETILNQSINVVVTFFHADILRLLSENKTMVKQEA
jgi:hypothetical protein